MFKGNYAINTFGVKMRSSVENYSKVLDKIIKIWMLVFNVCNEYGFLFFVKLFWE